MLVLDVFCEANDIMNYLNYTQNATYLYYEKQISNLMAVNQKKAAQHKAFEWLQEYVDSLCITAPWNWKISKKQIAASFFGKPESVYLYFGDSLEKGIDFIESHSQYNIRCSFHRYNTACHSESYRINTTTMEWLKTVKNTMDRNDIIEIFTESSTSTSTCFRRFSLQFNEEISYEMGYGQAMYVFEAERGKHDVAGMHLKNGSWELKKASDSLLNDYLVQLIKRHERYLSMKTQCICYYLGIPQISIEGYFDVINQTEEPIIVDIDLPFDKAFF